MKWITLLAILAFGCALIGYGILPLIASEATSQSDFVGWMMILAGIPCLVFLAANIKAMRNSSQIFPPIHTTKEPGRNTEQAL